MGGDLKEGGKMWLGLRLVLLVGLFFLNGCLVRTYTIQKPRQDLEIEGNQGYLVGTPPAPGEGRLGKERTVSVVEVELGPHRPEHIQPSLETEGLREGKELTEEGGVEESEEVKGELAGEEKTPVKTYKYYTVQKNDTLQKISQKFYGTTKKWKLLYEENKDILKSPDELYPEMKLKIPSE